MLYMPQGYDQKWIAPSGEVTYLDKHDFELCSWWEGLGHAWQRALLWAFFEEPEGTVPESVTAFIEQHVSIGKLPPKLIAALLTMRSIEICHWENDPPDSIDEITDLSPLKRFLTLEHFCIRNNQLQSLEPLRYVSTLKSIEIIDSPITSLQPIWDLCLDSLITYVTPITDTEIKDYIADHPITNVYCIDQQGQEISQFIKDGKVIQSNAENQQPLEKCDSELSTALPIIIQNELGDVESMTRQGIQEIATQYEIPYLLHFTRTENLESIINSGIYPISRINEISVEPAINDQLRLDGRCDGTSISIAFPNCQMFYKYRKENEETDWAIVVLHPSVLWLKDCAFCKHNAADTRISCQDIESLKTQQALQELFAEIENLPSRAEQCLKPFDPTDVQAEVLVFDVIEPSLIAGVVFECPTVKEKFSNVTGGLKTWIHSDNKGLFASRNYVRKYT